MLNDITVRGRVLPSDEQPKEQQRVTLVLCGFAEHEHHKEQHKKNSQQGQEEGQTTSLYLNYQLPVMERYGNVISVTAKSVTRIITPVLYKAQQDAYRPFLLPDFQHTYQFMAGLKGLPSGRPVSLYAGGDNPFSPVTKSELSLWVTGSTIQGDCPMAITCRLALLEGHSPILCNRRVRGYIVLSFNSHQQARKEARRLNAVVCGWRV
ncbi:hypothetical protein GZ77_18140 [Endozoicomonas montiporae]|uniref:Uncharacterized protein n=2 Tax=Endozoicomonas montiporae TaxID=1027273 RepID=A0A081N1X4_9GAMM|nr:ash family protein [Endozoicomonas montiporae]KEQ12447.1 hypothetical protein GZ77_18140 [Endozoicomonas montiporae]